MTTFMKTLSGCILMILMTLSASYGDSILRIGNEITNLEHLKEEIRQYHNSGAWEKDRVQLISKASQYIEKFDFRGKRAAIVLDIDDTSLSNYEGLERLDFAMDFTLPQLIMWFCEGKPQAIVSTLEFYKKAKEKGFRVFFITGRYDYHRSITEKNLRDAGFTDYDGLYMYPEGDKEKSVVPFKSGVRKKLEEEGYVIVVNMGDQESDLEGGSAEFKVKLPNPMYYVP